METDIPPPPFTVGQEIATFLVSCGILSKAWEESLLASGSESFTLNEYEGVAYVAFPSFRNIEAYIVEESGYGECNIQTDNRVFSACLKGNGDQQALVHQGALKLFLHIMENTDFQAKLQMYTDSKQKRLKPIVFVGHSLGGAVATLATLWVLEKRLRQSSPFCITFGCPLVGDGNLVEAIDRENWGGRFCHVVSNKDIVPRILLAPFESTAEPLWGKVINGSSDQPDSFIQEAYKTFCQYVRGSNYSPYKPLGTYMFCSRHGAACVANSETILEMLRLTMQSQETCSDKIVQDFFLEHIEYGSVLQDVMQNSIIGTGKVNSNSESSFEMGISLQLNAISIREQDENAVPALRSASETENKRNRNVDRLAILLSQRQCTMAEVEWYKEVCEKGQQQTSYYDAFKNQIDRRDIEADVRRLKLAEFWDDIIEMWKSHELPSDFQSQNKWINAGTAYRRLVEPLDIAHYYRISKGKGNYLSDGRPTRYKVLEKWMEEKERTRYSSRARGHRTKLASLTENSKFWAYVEEAVKDLKNLKNGQHQSLQNLQEFERNVGMMVNSLSISSDVFLGGSSFMVWWEEWKEYNQKQSPEWRSPLYEIMANETWKG